MFKVTWNEKSDEFKKCFAICNGKSAISLYWNLLKGGSSDGLKAINVKMWDLSGNEIPVQSFWETQGEYT